MLDYKDITAAVSKSEPDEDGNFNVTIRGHAEGEQYDWPLGTYTEETWALEEQQRLHEFKKKVMTQFD